MRTGQVGMVVACVGAVLLGWAALSTHWFSADVLGLADVHVGLRAVRICLVGDCQTASIAEVFEKRGLAYRVSAWLTLGAALVAAALVVAGVAWRLTRFDERPLRWALRAVGFAGAGSLLSFFTFPGGGVEVGAGFWMALAGSLAIIGGAIAMLLPDDSWMDAPVRPPAPVPASRAAPAPGMRVATPLAVPALDPGTPAVSEAERRRREVELQVGSLSAFASYDARWG